jgi:peptidoglycan hydrolase-like protein with peptidoglycan-binding domain
MSNPLLDLMVKGESGTAGYNAYNRGTYVDDQGGKHIRGPNGAIDFSSLTLGQVLDRQNAGSQDPNRLFAVGKYQIIPDTMNGAVKGLSLDRNQPFTPELQDKIFSQYLIVDKRSAVHNYISGQPGASLESAQRGLAQEWASFGDPDKKGASHYPLPNVASISLAQAEQALNQMRTSYKADMDRGMSPSDAWAAVTASNAAPAQTQHAPTTHKHQSSSHATTHVTTLLAEGDRDHTVTALQENLAKLGYHDAQNHTLKADGNFGAHTREAVQAFQRDHHLSVDGFAGPKTLEAIHQASAKRTVALPLSDKRNPDNVMYQQALDSVHKLDATMGRKSDQQSENLAASVTVAAKAHGMTRIDAVAISEDGSRTFAAQNGAFKQVAEVQTAAAVNTPVAQSTQQIQHMTSKQPDPAQTHIQTPQQTANTIGV